MYVYNQKFRNETQLTKGNKSYTLDLSRRLVLDARIVATDALLLFKLWFFIKNVSFSLSWALYDSKSISLELDGLDATLI